MIRLTLLDPSRGGAAADVAVRTAPGTPLHTVRDGLCAAAGSPPAALFCAGRELPPDAALGLPPLVDGAVLSVGAPTAAPAPALLEAHVVAGPDAGAVLPLPPGGWTVGRAAGAAVRIADPDLSRVHALLRVEGAGVSVSDAGSTNGTWVDGSAVGTEPVALAPAAVVRIGSSSLRVRAPDGTPAAVRADGTGGVVVNRPPRFVEPSAAVEVRRPTRRPAAGG